MAFMKKAEASRQAENDEELRLLRRAISGEAEEESDNGSELFDRPVRQKFGKSEKKVTKQREKAPERNEFEARLSEDEDETLEEAVTLQSNTDVSAGRKPESTRASQLGQFSIGSDGAKLNTKTGSQSRKLKTQTVSRSNVSPKGSGAKDSALNDYTSSSESENEVNDDGLDQKSKLALEIFAGDDDEDLKKQFEKEKKEIIREEGDRVIDNSLPGWGSWTGAGVSKREQQKGKGQRLSTIKGVAPEARRDAKLDRVIINEKTVKKNGKYLAAELPHPFESRQQYERALRLPMGPEWSTRNHFQDSIKPRVLLKQGQVIKPMARPTA